MILTAPPTARRVRAFCGWTIALAGSILLNITLFGLMPGLIQRIPAEPDKLEALKNIQVIRVKKAETPVRKKEPPKITKPKPVRQVRQKKLTMVKQKKLNIKPRLKFELNPKLPSAPMDLAMPPLEHFTVDRPVLKDVYDISELDSEVMALVCINAPYPLRAIRRGIEGFVTVEFIITSKGLVKDITIVKAEPEDIFNKTVLNSVAHWKFKPPTVEGIPVAARYRRTIRFKLEDE